MKTTRPVENDERTLAVSNAIYRAGYFFLIMALNVDMMVRAFARHETPLDLLALVIGTGVVCTIFQARQRVLPGGWVRKVLLPACLFGVLGAIFGVVLAMIAAK